MTNTLPPYMYLIKYNLIKHMRSYAFLLVIGISLFMGYVCAPAASDGYEVFYIGGVRGIYNSAWLGGMAAMLSTLLLWLFGFFMLRSQISEDQRLKVSQLIASTPVGSLRYITGKAASNFLILIVIEMVLLIAFMGMQLLRGEDYQLHIEDYATPFLFVTLPSLFLLSAFTILFDTVPGLKGVIGNFVFFSLWVLLSVISIANPSNWWDLFGLQSILANMAQDAALKFPSLTGIEGSGSFGYYPVEGKTPTFEWHGAAWDHQILMVRIVWIAVGTLIIFVSVWLYSRLKANTDRAATNPFLARIAQEVSIASTATTGSTGSTAFTYNQNQSFILSPVEKKHGLRLLRLVKSELRMMLKGLSLWWYLIAAALMAGSLAGPLDSLKSWLPIVMLWPIMIWSLMGTRDNYFSTHDLVRSSCSPILKWFTDWAAGVIVTLLFSASVMVHFALEAQWHSLYSWGIGVLFVPTLALTLGSLSGSKKLFEVIYMLWWYLGPINNIPFLDFLGISADYSRLYLLLSCGLIALATAIKLWQARNFTFIRR